MSDTASSGFTPDDSAHMTRALATRGARANSRPGPTLVVGCVVVRDGDQVIGRRLARPKTGEGHAEVNALADAGGNAAVAPAVYVTLEPCTHHGRTPPCVDALIQGGRSRRSWSPTLDPSDVVDRRPRHAPRLQNRRAFAVRHGLLADEACA